MGSMGIKKLVELTHIHNHTLTGSNSYFPLLTDEGDSKRDWIDGAVCLPGGMSAMQAVVIQTEYYEEDGFAVDEIELSGEECQDGGTNGQGTVNMYFSVLN